MEIVLGLAAGIGLSAATGFRIFVPFLVMSAAAHSGHLDLSPGFDWLGSMPALIALSVATVLEITAYYVPWLDNLLDTVATPAAVVAGTIATAAVVGDMSPFLRWTIAAIAGGGVAGIIQTSTTLLRGTSSLTTGGLANPLVATGELAGSAATSVMALSLPVIGLVILSMGLFVIWKRVMPGNRRVPVEVRDDDFTLQEINH